jgi:hypothetical protein
MTEVGWPIQIAGWPSANVAIKVGKHSRGFFEGQDRWKPHGCLRPRHFTWIWLTDFRLDDCRVQEQNGVYDLIVGGGGSDSFDFQRQRKRLNLRYPMSAPSTLDPAGSARIL